tara:strand:+ start:1252 stop:1530 length:279 start_codon:yes stop_codon:yes gene_type:complete
MIDTDKHVEFLAKHAPSTKKQIYVADTSCGRIQGELWHIAMSFLIEVKRLREELNAKIALITEVDTMIGDKWNVTQDDWNELVNKHYGDDEE